MSRATLPIALTLLLVAATIPHTVEDFRHAEFARFGVPSARIRTILPFTVQPPDRGLPLPERLVHPHEVLAIEDSQAGLAAAAGAGLLTLGVAHTYPESLLAAADAVAASLDGLDLARLERLLAEKSRR